MILSRLRRWGVTSIFDTLENSFASEMETFHLSMPHPKFKL